MELGEAPKHARAGARRRIEVAIAAAYWDTQGNKRMTVRSSDYKAYIVCGGSMGNERAIVGLVEEFDDEFLA